MNPLIRAHESVGYRDGFVTVHIVSTSHVLHMNSVVGMHKPFLALKASCLSIV